jgi:CubicO group peptidase (beta-lactamase class C family)
VSNSSPSSAAITGLLDRATQLGRLPGAVFRLEDARGVVASGAVGRASSIDPLEPADEGRPYDLASLTKALATAPLIALLASAGRLDLDGRIADYLDELRDAPCGQASLGALATHTAGLAAWHPLYLEGAGSADFLQALARMPLAGPPGRAVYSDLGYMLLGWVVERVAALPLDEAFTQHVARPLGLERLGYARDPRAFADAAPTEIGNEYERVLAGTRGARHAWRRGSLRGEVHDGNAHALGGVAGHAGLFGTAADVCRLGRELLEPRHLPLSPREKRSILQPLAPAVGRTLGMVLASHARAARGILPDSAPGHTGFTGTSIWLLPEAGAVLVLLTNRVHPSVPTAEFAPLRRAFHRLARTCVEQRSAGPPAPPAPPAKKPAVK